MDQAPSFAQSASHVKSSFLGAISSHPGKTAILVAALVVLCLVLAYYVFHYKAMCKSGFHTMPISNMTTGNNNPEWQLGSMDAGNWGPVHRDATPWNIAVYHPGWRAGRYRRVPGKEGLTSMPPGAPNACGPGETPVSYQNPDGSMMTYCRNTDALPGPPTVCGTGWDPAASAEAEALATVGSLQHEPLAERRLQRAVNAAYDANLGMSDEQLAALMHQGGTP